MEWKDTRNCIIKWEDTHQFWTLLWIILGPTVAFFSSSTSPSLKRSISKFYQTSVEIFVGPSLHTQSGNKWSMSKYQISGILNAQHCRRALSLLLKFSLYGDSWMMVDDVNIGRHLGSQRKWQSKRALVTVTDPLSQVSPIITSFQICLTVLTI